MKAMLSKPVIDEIEHLLAKHYGLTDEELDFIVNYDIKCGLGSSNESVRVGNDRSVGSRVLVPLLCIPRDSKCDESVSHNR